MYRYLNSDGTRRYSLASLTKEGIREFLREKREFEENCRAQGGQDVRGRLDGSPQSLEVENVDLRGIRAYRVRKAQASIKENIDSLGEFFKTIEVNEKADFLLYYLRFKFKNRYFYKIGVTTTSVEKRLGEDFAKVEKIVFAKRVVGALAVEQRIKQTNAEHCFPLAILRSGNGFTEFFDRDVLGVDVVETMDK